jgi:hypothetical protein
MSTLYPVLSMVSTAFKAQRLVSILTHADLGNESRTTTVGGMHRLISFVKATKEQPRASVSAQT